MPGHWPCLQRTLQVSYCIDLSSSIYRHAWLLAMFAAYFTGFLGYGLSSSIYIVMPGHWPCLQRTLQVSYCIDLSSSIYRHAWLLAMFAAYFTGFLLY